MPRMLGSSTSSHFATRSATYSAGPRSSGLNSTMVGTRTAPRTSLTSASRIARKSATAAPGLSPRRMCVTNQSTNSGSSAPSGAHCSTSSSKKSLRPQRSPTSAIRLRHSSSLGAHG